MRWWQWLLIGGGLVLGLVIVATYVQTLPSEPAAIETPDGVITLDVSSSDALQSEVWEAVYDLALTSTGIAPDRFTVGDQEVAFLDRAQKLIVTVDLRKKSFRTLPWTRDETPLALATYGDSLLTVTNQLYQWDAHERQWQADSETIAYSPAHLVAFGPAIYLLDDVGVYKMSTDDTDYFGPPQQWLADGESLDGAPVDVFINGFVYVSDGQGKVRRYLRGVLDYWRIDAPLVGPVYITGDVTRLLLFTPEDGFLRLYDLEAGQVLASSQDQSLHEAKFIWASGGDIYTLRGREIWRLTDEQFLASWRGE